MVIPPVVAAWLLGQPPPAAEADADAPSDAAPDADAPAGGAPDAPDAVASDRPSAPPDEPTDRRRVDLTPPDA